ncbi:putative peptidoglycan lipid II flippase [Natronospira proteinivora]|uniref:Probable lipid II flippase MurJ n=1 Tax=Natronospira proteinivora TaxID=1807133 RepID=A0ABT1G7B5_9GAMM|nr:murein biosynthesis integral membrane protein MurJ [Natronospira proteinivora]MCP1726218.1 putative peptidoglycan lipid II flippase [Natronospira proteinivora]
MSLLRSTGLVGSMTLLSRVLGFLRDVVFARVFGAGPVMDAFIVAFKIPNFMRRLFAEGGFSQAFVPVLGEYRSKQDHAQVQALVDRVAGVLGGVLALITLLGVIAAPLLIWVFAPGFDGDDGRRELAVAMLRWTFPYLLFISLVSLAAGILNTYNRFGVPAFTPVLLNLVLIGAAIWGAPYFAEPGMALAVGVFGAGLVQLLFQIPFLKQLRLLPRPRWDRQHEGVRRIMRLMAPAVFGSSVAQINLLIDTIIASFLITGSVSWLYYSDRLMEFPLGVFGIALGTVILPGLSARHAEQDHQAFSDTLDWALRLVWLVAVPAAVGLLCLAGPMLATLFQYGAFSDRDVEMASYSLMAYAMGLVGFTLVKVLAPGYFARQDTVTPVKAGVVSMVCNIALNAAIVIPMVMTGFIAPHMGLALATSMAAFINAGLLFAGLMRRGIYRPRAGWRGLFVRGLLANLAMAGVVVWLAGSLDAWLAASVMTRVLDLAVAIAVGGGVYAVTLLLMGLRPRHVA